MKQEINTTKYILYARKSSESEDKQMASIDSQIEELTKIAKDKGFEIKEVMHESMSAKAPGRVVFNEMVEKLKKGEAQGIICWKLNRLSRNPVDNGTISWLLQSGIVKHIFTYGRDYYPEDNVLVMAVEQGMANQYIRDLAIDTRRGLISKAKRGWYPCHAPLGYRHNPIKQKGEKEIIIDENSFDKVQKMFKMVASGKHTPVEVYELAIKEWELVNLKGQRPALSTWYYMLNNTFYYGWYEYPSGSGDWHKGKHKAMISQGEFEKIQMILGKRGAPKPVKYKFKYTGFVRCGECGASITAEHKIKRQKNGNVHHYIYYHCTKRKDPNCDQRVVEEKALETEIEDTLDRIKLHPSFLDWAIEKLKEENIDQIEKKRREKEEDKKEYESFSKKINNLLDMRLNDELSELEFRTKKQELAKEKARLRAKMDEIESNSNWVESLEETKNTLNFAKDALNKFRNGDEETKKEIFRALGSNLYLLDKKIDIKRNNKLVGLEKVSLEVNSILKKFEPLKSPINKEKLELAYSSCPTLLQRLE
jgi:DNA invertase Pin-like site-specific DNA recombinase/predicted metal-binding protein